MKLFHAAPALAATLSLAACSGNGGAANNGAAAEETVLNDEGAGGTDNLTITDTPLTNQLPGNDAFGADAYGTELDAEGGNTAVGNAL